MSETQNKVTQAEFYERIKSKARERKPNQVFSNAQVQNLAESVFDVLKDCITANRPISISKFGKFFAKEREATNIAAFKPGAPAGMPQRINTVAIKFAPSAGLKSEARKAFGLE